MGSRPPLAKIEAPLLMRTRLSSRKKSMIPTAIAKPETKEGNLAVLSVALRQSDGKIASSPSPPLPFANGRTPLTGYMLFLRKERKALLKVNPEASIEEIMKRCHSAWNTLDEGKKKEHNSLAHAINARLGTVSPDSSADYVKENNDQARIVQFIKEAPVKKPAKVTPFKISSIPSKIGSTGMDSASVKSLLVALKRKMNPIGDKSIQPSSQIARLGSFPSTSHPQPSPYLQYYPHNSVVQSPPLSQEAALEFYYLSLCQPAFPESGEISLVPAPPSFYLEHYNALEWQKQMMRL